MNEINKQSILSTAKNVINSECDALNLVSESIGNTFIDIVEAILNCNGKVIMTGMGKSGHIARKISATMSSLGIPSVFLHPGEAMHGDLGMIESKDIVIAISYSGESSEILNIIPSIRTIHAKLISITNSGGSTLSKKSDIAEVLPKVNEACHLGLAPTSSTTSTLAYGDALAVSISKYRQFTKNNFGIFHPAGSLGKRLVYRVPDLMTELKPSEYLSEDEIIIKAISAMMNNKCGILPVINKSRELIGIITNGIIDRAIANKINIHNESIKEFIIYDPVYINVDAMAVDALMIMEKYNISAMPVVNDDRVIGIIQKEIINRNGIRI